MKFIKGMDLSSFYELEKIGVRYYDHFRERDLLDIFRDYDVDTIRIRIWNDPYSENNESYGAGENSVENSLYIAKKVSAAGFRVLLDFHYSDFWADPGKQFKPKAWETYSVEELEQAVEAFTYETMARYIREGANISMVQVGNEITNGLLWLEGKIEDHKDADSYINLTKFIDAGIRGVRRADEERIEKLFDNEGNELSQIPIMIHLDNGGNNELYRDWFDHYIALSKESFDIIGLSYYPFWHGTLDGLEHNLHDLSTRYGKDLIVAEVSMGFSLEDYRKREGLDENTGKGYATKKELVEKVPYPMTPEGQRAFTEDFLRIVQAEGAKGFFWWEPAWIPVKGSGWATEASLKYIHDPGPCGNEWGNQTLFDYDGNVLPTLELIKEFKAQEKEC